MLRFVTSVTLDMVLFTGLGLDDLVTTVSDDILEMSSIKIITYDQEVWLSCKCCSLVLVEPSMLLLYITDQYLVLMLSSKFE